MKESKISVRARGLLIVLVICSGLFGADKPSKEITSNNILGFAGNGDTLWMVTDQGINVQVAADTPFTWLGYKSPFKTVFSGIDENNRTVFWTIPFSFGASKAVFCLDTAKYLTPNAIRLYGPPDFSVGLLPYDSVILPFNRSLQTAQNLKDSAVFMASGVAFGAGYFWIACNDGGLVRLDPSTKAMRAFFPGIAKKSFDPALARIDSITGDTAVTALLPRRIIAVAVQKASADTTVVLAMTKTTLYRFFPADTTWDTLPGVLDGKAVIDKYNTVFASNRSPFVFADISANGYASSKLYRYNGVKGAWTGFDSLVTGLTFGPDSVTYLVINNKSIKKINGTSVDSASISLFDSRISQAMGSLNPEFINDVAYFPRNATSGAFWIATSSLQSPAWNGLFFSPSEETDEKNKTPFVYIRRDRKINSSLKETYAVPGILSSTANSSGTASQAVFAYSLSKGSNVTITVYDWNMNVVKVVTPNKYRPAGTDDPTGNGRSTDRKADVWDGTNSAGKRVAIGVYYFKIAAESEHSFGKIIVAK